MNNPDYFDRQKLVLFPDTPKKMRRTKVLVVGDGAAGNAVIENLALSGFCMGMTVDFDKVENSNLSKSALFRKSDVGKPKAQVIAERFKEYCLIENPEFTYINGNMIYDVGKGAFWDYDVIILCVDEDKCRIYVSDWCVRAGKPLIEIGFEKFQLNVSLFAPVGKTYPICLREYMGQGNFDGKRNSCSGLKVRDTEMRAIPAIQYMAAMSGAIAVMELVKYLEGRSSILNKTLYYYGLTQQTLITGYEPDPACKIHEEAFVDLLPVKVPCEPTVQQVLDAVEKTVGHEVEVSLPEEFIISGRCNGCGKEMKINRRKSQLWDDERWCEECRSHEGYETHLNYGNEWVSVSAFTANSDPAILQMKLKDLGVPKDDVLKVVGIVEDEFVSYYVRIVETEAKRFKITPMDSVPVVDLDEDVSAFFDNEGDESDVKALEEVKRVFASDNFHVQEQGSPFTSYVKKQALDDFIDYADNIYQTKGNEATGVILGYYCASKQNPDHKMAVATTFFPATGRNTQTTCEVSEEDCIAIMNYCQKHKMLPLVWIHSHPGFGAFYSGVDNHTLLNKYRGPHQSGIVVDNLKCVSKAFKTLDGKVSEINYFIYETDGKRCWVWDKGLIKNRPIFKKRLRR